MKPFRPEHIYIDEESLNDPLTERVTAGFPGVPYEVLKDGTPPPELLASGGNTSISRGKRTVYLRRNKGKFIERCPGTRNPHICCNYFIASVIVNCHLDCTYCFLQSYLTERYVTVYTNIPDFLAEVDEVAAAAPGRRLRIGTGELADSLAMDELTGLSRELVPFFAGRDDVLLELKTKGNYVDNLLDLDPGGGTVIAWSLNTPEIVRSEEHKCSTLEQRLDAARKCRDAGYKLAFHFDPIIEHDGWMETYPAVVDRMYELFGDGDVLWVSLGVLRYTPAGRESVRERFPDSAAFYGEQVPCADGKLRYIQPVRTKIYRALLDRIRKYDKTAYVYFCMESPAVWNKLFGDNSPEMERLSVF